jgi:hypothetical protein
MFVIQNIKTKKFVAGSDFRYVPPHQFTSYEQAITFERKFDAELEFKKRQCGKDYKIVKCKLEVIEPTSLINSRKLELLENRIKKYNFYSLVLNWNGNETSVDVVNNKREKKLKPYWTYNKKEQKAIKKFMLCYNNATLEYTEEELLNYANKLKKEGFEQCLHYTRTKKKGNC